MFERFTEKAIKVIMLAQEEARLIGHNFVGTEQILLGLIKEGTGVGGKVLVSKGLNLEDTRIEVEKIIGRGSGFAAVEIPFTPRSKRVLELAWDESRGLGTDYVGTEHLLLGLLREGEGVAARVLENLDVDIETLRWEILKSVSESTGISPANPRQSAENQGSLSRFTNIEERFDKATQNTNSLLEFLVSMLSPAAQKIIGELAEVVRKKERALLDYKFEEAAPLLGKQIEITEKLRLLVEASGESEV